MRVEKPIEKYRGCEIHLSDSRWKNFVWEHPEYEWSSDLGAFGYGYSDTIEGCKEEIDMFYENYPEHEL